MEIAGSSGACSCVDFFEKSEPFDLRFVLGVLEFLEMSLCSGSNHGKDEKTIFLSANKEQTTRKPGKLAKTGEVIEFSPNY
jgi:hypothetical protein